jgi:hypothetical protein
MGPHTFHARRCLRRSTRGLAAASCSSACWAATAFPTSCRSRRQKCSSEGASLVTARDAATGCSATYRTSSGVVGTSRGGGTALVGGTDTPNVRRHLSGERTTGCERRPEETSSHAFATSMTRVSVALGSAAVLEWDRRQRAGCCATLDSDPNSPSSTSTSSGRWSRRGESRLIDCRVTTNASRQPFLLGAKSSGRRPRRLTFCSGSSGEVTSRSAT